MKILINNIIRQMKEIRKGKPWMGESFSKKIETLSEVEALTRPLPTLHSVAEIISHLTAWRKDACLKIRKGTGKLVIESDENWLDNNVLKKIGWPKIKADYDESLNDLLGLIQNKDDEFLNESYYDNDYKGEYNYLFLIEGMVHHDIYHLGQIGIVIKFLNEAGSDKK